MTSFGEVIVASMNNAKPSVVDTDDSSALTESNIIDNFGNKCKAVAGCSRLNVDTSNWS